MPLAAALTLLAVVPVLAAAVSAFELLPVRSRGPGGRRRPPPGGADTTGGGRGGAGARARAGSGATRGRAAWRRSARPTRRPPNSPGASRSWRPDWPSSRTSATTRRPPRRPAPLPGHAEATAAGVLGGWALTAVGLVLAGPGLVHLCGSLLTAVRPRRCGCWPGAPCSARRGAWAGRSACCAPSAAPDTSSPTCTAPGPARPGTLLRAAHRPRRGPGDDVRQRHGPGDRPGDQGRPRGDTARPAAAGRAAGTLRGAAAVRGAALLLVLVPLAWAVGRLATLPFTS
ncbi:hypothetical protein NKH77_37490 [Streptomyces sp. M19]